MNALCRLLSAASKNGLLLPSGVVTSLNSDGTETFEVVTALLHENQNEEYESFSAAVVSYLDGHLREVLLTNGSPGAPGP